MLTAAGWRDPTRVPSGRVSSETASVLVAPIPLSFVRIARRTIGRARGIFTPRAIAPDIFVRAAAACVFPIVAGGAAQLLFVAFGVTHLSFVFMTSVICAGAYLGAAPALVAAILAFAIYNFFLVEPNFSLQLASADDFVTLILFLVAALVTGGLAGRLRDRADVSRQQLRTTLALYEASRRLSRAVDIREVDQALAESAEHAFAAPAIVLRTDAAERWVVCARSPSSLAVADGEAEWCGQAIVDGSPHRGRWLVAAMQGQADPLGAIAVQTHPIAIDAEDQRTLQSLAGLGGVALERSVLISEMADARALAQSERLRSALLSSLSHDFRTPLATILASATSLIEYDRELEHSAKHEMLSSILDEAERMTRFVANLLDMTRLEAGALKPRLASIDVSEVALDAAGHVNRHAAAKGVRVLCEGGPVIAKVDPVLLERALLNILENAIAVSGAGDVIRIDVANECARGPMIVVTDSGPGIAPTSLPFVFDKFFRAPEHASRGVGLGLSISKGLVEEMGGTISVESPTPEGPGARFSICVRAAEA